MRDRFLRACRREKVDRVPVWFMRQAGRYMESYRNLRKKYSILQIARTPELARDVTLQPVRAFDVDAAILFSDILLPLEPLGLGLDFNPHPHIARPIQRPSCLKRLKDFDVEKKLGFVAEAIRLTVPQLNGLPLIGFSGAPFTLASYMIEGGPSQQFLKTKVFMHEHPEAWAELMLKIRALLVDFLRLQVSAGARAIQIFDSWIGALSPEDYRRFALPHSRFVIEKTQKTGVPVIYFGTGQSGFLEDFSSAGGDVIGVDWRIDINQAVQKIGGKAIQGNLDPALLLCSPREIKKGVSRILSQVGKKRGFIFNIGHGIFPQTDPAKVRIAIQQVHSCHV